MSITVWIDDIRPAWGRAKTRFWIENTGTNKFEMDPQIFREEFGKANGLTINIERFIGAFPVINEIEFDSEQSYAWFMLRWS
jgi:hypothetical protein